MSDRIQSPAPRPCESCPYRLDVPSGVWSRDNYEKLPRYDAPTGQQPTSMFECHQANGRVCGGWAGCHDMEESLALRLAVIMFKTMTPEDVDRTRSYVSPVPLHPSGRAAAEHGLAELDRPGPAANRLKAKLIRQRPDIAADR